MWKWVALCFAVMFGWSFHAAAHRYIFDQRMTDAITLLSNNGMPDDCIDIVLRDTSVGACARYVELVRAYRDREDGIDVPFWAGDE